MENSVDNDQIHEDIINILDFPDEILLTIFEYLSPMDRRIASLCCKRFLDIWFSDIFQGDRNRIVIHGWLLENQVDKPWQILLDSNRIITEILLIDVNFSENQQICLSKLWEKLGATVTSLEIDRKFHSNWPNGWPDKKFWNYFSKLKVLTFALQEEDNYENLPQKLEKLIIVDELDVGFDTLGNEYLKKRQPSSIVIESDFYVPSDILTEYANYFSKIRSSDLNECDLIFNNVKYLRQNVREAVPKNIFEIIEHKYPSLNYLYLSIKQFPCKNVPYLKKIILLNIQPEECETKLKMLKNVEELRLDVKTKNGCFFGHKPFLNKNMKEFDAMFSDETLTSCIECFTAMATSYPRLETLYLNNGTNEHLKIIKTHLPKLQNLIIQRTYFENFEKFNLEFVSSLTELHLNYGFMAEYLNYNFPMMKYLRKFKIYSVDKNFVEVFCRKTPILEELKISMDEKEENDYEEIMELIVKNLKRLNKLSVDTSFISKKNNENICNMMVQYCPFIKQFYHFEVIKNRGYRTNTIIFKNAKFYIKEVENTV